MRKARSTTPEERLAIVHDCLANDKNYGAMALKYQCSYQQVRNWVKRYEEMGSAGLEDRRGHRVGTMPSRRTPEEEMRDRIAELEKRNRDLQMENDLLKKVRELEHEGSLSLTRHRYKYQAIRKLSEERHYPVESALWLSSCPTLSVL